MARMLQRHHGRPPGLTNPLTGRLGPPTGCYEDQDILRANLSHAVAAPRCLVPSYRAP